MSEMEKKIEKIFGIFDKIVSELISLNTDFYRERLLVIGKQYVNSLKISRTTKNNFFDINFFQIVPKIWQSYCRVDLGNDLEPLTCWLSISVLTRAF